NRWYDSPVDVLDRYRRYIAERLNAGCDHVRILGEPVWPDRSRAEIGAWIRYEALINVALATTPTTIVCAYATTGLAPAVLSGMRRTHPEVETEGTVSPCADYTSPETVLLEA